MENLPHLSFSTIGGKGVFLIGVKVSGWAAFLLLALFGERRAQKALFEFF